MVSLIGFNMIHRGFVMPVKYKGFEKELYVINLFIIFRVIVFAIA
ncbi:hypothetical protein ATE84_2761 [Aquimarina sp. MAR_2010_214]|nr:hypothetical protein ATE84_2761 [Aquimarina sp. MAR_2010_214]